MSEDERLEEILNTIQKIKESKQPVTDYFKQNEVPFSRAQYYNYCITLQKSGGGEILTFLAYYTNIIDVITKTVIQRIDEIHKSIVVDNSKIFKPDHPELRNHGKFTREYTCG